MNNELRPSGGLALMRTLAEIQADIRALEAETGDLIAEFAGDAS